MLAEAACFYQVNVLVYRDFFVQWRLLCVRKINLSEHAVLLNGPNHPLSGKTPGNVACLLGAKRFTGVRARSGKPVHQERWGKTKNVRASMQT